MINLEGQKVVVTGGSRGLGLGIVEALTGAPIHRFSFVIFSSPWWPTIYGGVI